MNLYSTYCALHTMHRYREIHEVIPTGLRLTLMIGGVQEADLGVYNCSATNVYGSSYHLITLHSSGQYS